MGFRFVRRPIPPSEALSSLRTQGAGGVSLFLGVVRPDRTARGSVRALDYEAYVPVARREMARLEGEARSRWKLLDVVVLHRLGRVPAGEVSVAVAVAALHRKEAFSAGRFLIDQLKRDVPIWKSDVVRSRARSGSPRPLRPSRAAGRAGGSRRAR